MIYSYKWLLVFFCFWSFNSESYAQVYQIYGKAIDSLSKRPIVNSLVIIKNRNGGLVENTTTNIKGEFFVKSNYQGLVSVTIIAKYYLSATEDNVRLNISKTQIVNFALEKKGDIEEIIVTGQAQASGKNGSIVNHILSREEIRRAPGTAGDVFRGLSSLPGVTATGAYSNFSVRGRGPRDNIILIDGIPYDRAVHFDQSLGEEGEIGGGGRFSIFGQNVIGQAEFSPGGWSSEYGGANGSLLNLKLAEGNRETPTFSGKFDLAGGEFLYDGPSYAFGNTSLLVSLRYYDFGQLFDLIGAKEIGSPVLSDVLFKSTSRFNNETTLNIIALYTPEKYTRDIDNVLASPDFNDPMVFKSNQKAGMLGFTLNKLIGETGEWKNTFYYRQATDNSAQGQAYPDIGSATNVAKVIRQEDDIITLREIENELGWQSDYSTNNIIGRYKVGVYLLRLDVNYNQSLSRHFPLFVFDNNDFRAKPDQKYILLTPELYDAALRALSFRGSVYFDQTFSLKTISITTGVRAEYDDILSSKSLSPRLQINWQVNARTEVSITTGTYYQAPRLLEIAGNSANTSLKNEKTNQFSLGLEYAFQQNYLMQIDTYYQNMTNLVPNSDRVSGILSNNGHGWAVGLDWILHKQFSNRWSSSLRYSYNKTKIYDGDGEPPHPSQFNRPHLANFTLNYEMNDRWSFGLQYQIASGRPADNFIIHDNVYSDFGLLRYSREITGLYSSRYPSFQTLNLRVDYRRQIGGTVVKGFIDIINALGRQNRDEVEFSSITGLIDKEGLGVFPQIGVSIEF